jgi:hypothetical protein
MPALPLGFMPLPHPKQSAGGQVFPQRQIDEIQYAEHRDLKCFDVDFDLPDHLTPEFPPPIFLSSRPDLGDVSGGKLLTIRNFYAMLVGMVAPVQLEVTAGCEMHSYNRLFFCYKPNEHLRQQALFWQATGYKLIL